MTRNLFKVFCGDSTASYAVVLGYDSKICRQVITHRNSKYFTRLESRIHISNLTVNYGKAGYPASIGLEIFTRIRWMWDDPTDGKTRKNQKIEGKTRARFHFPFSLLKLSSRSLLSVSVRCDCVPYSWYHCIQLLHFVPTTVISLQRKCSSKTEVFPRSVCTCSGIERVNSGALFSNTFWNALSLQL